jgi:YesN/AraC family two-component response regulator
MKPCSTPNCRKKAEKNRTICRPCRTVREREANLARYSWRNQSRSAKRRGHVYTLTFEQYLEVAIPTGYLARKGRFKESLHMDRIQENLGYVAGNMQTLTNSENIRKYLDYKYNHVERKMEFKMRTQDFGKQDSDVF